MLNKPVIFRKNNNAGARATGRKFNLPVNIKKRPIIIINNMIIFLLFLGFNLLPNKK